ncbi:MAG: RHS repeat protein, partial [Halanaerobiales bacterium]|nr:RHS repeat protein [Halanaerobiales bacterium]
MEKISLNEKEYALSPYLTAEIEYDTLGRKIFEIAPQVQNEDVDTTQRSKIGYTYDRVGNLKTETLYKIDESGLESSLFTKSYNYYPQNLLKEELLNNKTQVSYEYDKVGNTRFVKDSLSNIVEYRYDGFDRVKEIIQPDGASIFKQYDSMDNVIYERDDNWNVTEWEYDNLGRLIRVDEPAVAVDTYYFYDPDGNLVKKRMSNGSEIDYVYNEIGNLMKESKLVNGENLTDYYGYYLSGGLKYKINPRGIKEEYSYDLRGLAKRVDYYSYDGDYYKDTVSTNTDIAEDLNWKKNEWTEYSYSSVGSITESGSYRVKADDSIIKISGIRMNYNSLNQVTELTREITNTGNFIQTNQSYDMEEYIVNYRYDAAGNVTGIKYPNSSMWLEYEYNEDNRLTDIRYNNGVNTRYELDQIGRVKEIEVNGYEINQAKDISESSLNFSYTYDGVGNVKTRNSNIYDYDRLDRLTKAEIIGQFYDETYGMVGYVPNDILADERIDFGLADDAEIKFDYASGSIGIAFGEKTSDIGRVVLLNDKAVIGADPFTNRITKRTLQILKTDDGLSFAMIPDNDWVFEKDLGGNIIITFKENLSTQFSKIHSNFDDRDRKGLVADFSEFINLADRIVKVYKRFDKVTVEYSYYSVGNREWKKVTSDGISKTDYSYYPAGYDFNGNLVKSNRLLEAKTVHDEKAVTKSYAYSYDREGNLVKKGNAYEIMDAVTDEVVSDNDSLAAVGIHENGVLVDYTKTSGIYVEYWEYGYNVKNRLETVRKNEEEIAKFIYDSTGQRIKSEENGRIVHYVYGLGNKLIYESEKAEGVADETVDEVKFKGGVYFEIGIIDVE